MDKWRAFHSYQARYYICVIESLQKTLPKKVSFIVIDESTVDEIQLMGTRSSNVQQVVDNTGFQIPNPCYS